MLQKLALAQVWPLGAQSLSQSKDIDFSTITYQENATGDISIGTNGKINYGSGFSGSGMGKAGSVKVNGSVGEEVNISCDNQAMLSNSDINLEIKNVELSFGQSGSAFGNGHKCEGIENAIATHAISDQDGENIIKFGAMITPSTNQMAKEVSLSTQNGGKAIKVMVVYN